MINALLVSRSFDLWNVVFLKYFITLVFTGPLLFDVNFQVLSGKIM
jgi:hypothetical protein